MPTKKYLPYIASIVIALLFTFTTFKGVKNNEFIFISDQFIKVSFEEASKSFLHLRKLENLGVHNAWQSTVQFFDSIYYLVSYKIGLTVLHSEMLLHFIITFLTLVVSFEAFKRLNEKVFGNTSTLSSFIVALFYTFNPYTFVLWHGGVYNLGSCLTYAFAPTLLYLVYKLTFLKSSVSTALALSVVLFLSSFVFWMLAPILFYLLLLTPVFLIINTYKTKSFPLRQLGLFSLTALVYLLLVGFILHSILFEFFNTAGYASPFSTPTYGNQGGGLNYILKLYFSWGIYNVWTPRTIYPKPITDYFFSNFYLFGLFSLYVMALLPMLYFLVKKSLAKLAPLYVIHLVLLLIFMFFAKANQPPFGEVFDWLYSNVAFFKVFRTADVRFGFVIVLCLSILLLYSSKFIKRSIFVVLTIFSIILLVFWLFTGKATRGFEIDNISYDRIVYQTEDSKGLIAFLNANKFLDRYVLILPGFSYHTFELKKGDFFVGQDIISKFVTSPFIYPNQGTTDLYLSSYQALAAILKARSYDQFNNLPVKYIVLRRDISCTDCYTQELEDLEKSRVFKQVFANSTFKVLEVPDSVGIVENVKNYVMKSPVYIPIFKPESTINLNLSYNDSWRLYYGSKINPLSLVRDYFADNGLKPRQVGPFMQFTNIPQAESYTLVFAPQILYYMLLELSLVTVSLVLIYLYNRKDV